MIFNLLQTKSHPMVHLVVPFLFFVFGTLPAKETKTAMSYEQLIDDMQKTIYVLQQSLDMLKINDDRFVEHVLFTRAEAADYIGVSTRQFDRYCVNYNIPKVKTLQGMRFRKTDILAHWDKGHRKFTIE